VEYDAWWKFKFLYKYHNVYGAFDLSDCRSINKREMSENRFRKLTTTNFGALLSGRKYWNEEPDDSVYDKNDPKVPNMVKDAALPI
jgi:hypothetical protein